MSQPVKSRLRSAVRTSPLRHPLHALLVRAPRAYFRRGRSAPVKKALWRLAEHTWWLETEETTRTAFDATMQVNAHDIVGRYISYFGVWEPDLTAWLRETLRPGDVFVDVGANVGYFTLLGSHLVGDTGCVVAIEAIPETAEVLQANVKRNGITNVRVVNAGVWHERTTLELYRDPGETTGTATVSASWAARWNIDGGHVSVTAAPLHELLTPGEQRRARVIKIDVEGAEFAAIDGLPEELPADAQLVVEIAPALLEESGASWEQLRDRLEARGFSHRVLRNDYSPAAYWTHSGTPRFIDAPAPGADQFDVVFSR